MTNLFKFPELLGRASNKLYENIKVFYSSFPEEQNCKSEDA